MDNSDKILAYNPYVKKNIHDQEDTYDQSNHLKYINLIINDEPFDCKSYIVRSLKGKLSSYKSQDKINKKFDDEQFIKYDDLLEKLRDSNLKCYYCNIDMFLVYKNKKETRQWSLERFDNNLGHYKTNTCISCLKCNLQRRQTNHEYFKFSKNMVIIKKKE